MAEPYVIKIINEADFDGTTLMTQSRNDFTQNGRIFSVTIQGPAGIIPADFFGLLSASAPKLVGVANDSWNPLNLAAVETEGVSSAPRTFATLSPQIQHFSMFGDDRLSVRTRNGGRSGLYLSVNALSERDHVDLALRRGRAPSMRHFRIRRNDGAGWSGDEDGNPLAVNFTYNTNLGILETVTALQGPISLGTLCPLTNITSCYVSVRFSGPTAGGSQLYVVDREQRRVVVMENALAEMAWSKVIYLTRDDLLLLKTPTPVAGAQIHADIQLVETTPRERFVGRYDRST